MAAAQAVRDGAAGPQASRRHLRGLEGLRGLAAISVLLYHASVFAPPRSHRRLADVVGVGWAGVDVFFAISGFILYLPFARAGYGGSTVRLGPYAARRARRILPAYLFNLFVLTTLAATSLLTTQHGLVAVLANATFSAGYADTTLINGVYWTLFCEVAFYILLPLLARLFVRRRWLVGFPLVLAVASAYKFGMIHLYGRAGHVPLSHALEQFPAVLDQFAVGMLAATVWVALERRRRTLKPAAALGLVAAGVFLMMAVLFTLQRGLGPSAYWSGRSALGWLPLVYFKPALSLGASLVILGVCYRDNWVTKLLECRPLRYLGLVSYGVYLWHLPLVRLIAPSLSSSHGDLVRYILCVGAAGGLALAWASVSYFYVERPWLTRRQRVERQGTPRGTSEEPADRSAAHRARRAPSTSSAPTSMVDVGRQPIA